jgi:hypothetical protein
LDCLPPVQDNLQPDVVENEVDLNCETLKLVDSYCTCVAVVSSPPLPFVVDVVDDVPPLLLLPPFAVDDGDDDDVNLQACYHQAIPCAVADVVAA